MERLTHGDKARRYGLGAGRSLRGFRRHVMQHNQDGIALVKLDIFGRSTTAELDTDLLGSSPPDSGLSGIREPRRPLSPTNSAALSTPLPKE
jgi:hypothetical protein